ncbi:tripartite tricarboxylate transporter TctB family protein [Herbaspirillum sp.]|uniref:tripartite tricarboxylate transporter TctB family protein n=1 Tax=Herbaspirillum sp. TaxID=1890675 RepID=UPI001B1A3F95|nr:tripartite tricarboxylate transporter TctB family protein [Herbaspirillum sp.]MBO9537819.1 tripartite tricarboxylate transporter TctB family protein [Herbaspirillum sp.]
MLDNNPKPSAAHGDGAVCSMRTAELALASLTTLIGAAVMIGSCQAGIGWTDTGPESGHFAFFVGLIMIVASLGTIFFTLRRGKTSSGQDEAFIARAPLRHVLAMFIPMCVYVVAIRLLGMYLASTLFIAWFMVRANDARRASWWRVALVSVGTLVVVYLVFERWFNVPLYAGPLAEMLGLAS